MRKLIILIILFFSFYSTSFAENTLEDLIDIRFAEKMGLFDSVYNHFGDDIENLTNEEKIILLSHPRTQLLNNTPGYIENIIHFHNNIVALQEEYLWGDPRYDILSTIKNVFEERYLDKLFIIDGYVYVFDNYYVLIDPDQTIKKETNNQRYIESVDIFEENKKIHNNQRSKEKGDASFSIRAGVLPNEMQHFPKLIRYNLSTGEKQFLNYDYSLLEDVLYLSNITDIGSDLRGAPYFKILGIGSGNNLIFADISPNRFGHSFRGVYTYDPDFNGVTRINLNALVNYDYSSFNGYYIPYKGYSINYNIIGRFPGREGISPIFINTYFSSEPYVKSIEDYIQDLIGGYFPCSSTYFFENNDSKNLYLNNVPIGKFNELTYDHGLIETMREAYKTGIIEYKCGEIQGTINIKDL